MHNRFLRKIRFQKKKNTDEVENPDVMEHIHRIFYIRIYIEIITIYFTKCKDFYRLLVESSY